MTTCLIKTCSFSLLCVSFVGCVTSPYQSLVIAFLFTSLMEGFSTLVNTSIAFLYKFCDILGHNNSMGTPLKGKEVFRRKTVSF